MSESAFEDGKNVMFVPPKDPAALSAAIDTLIANDALRCQLSSGATELAEAHFSWNTTLSRTEEVFFGR